MSYIDAIIERDKNHILVVERDKNGKRLFVTHPTRYVAYWPSEKGKWTSIFGTKLDRYQTTKDKDFKKELGVLPKGKIHESDINPIFRCLYENYKDSPTPDLHVGFFDIEVDFDPLRGFSSPDDAFSPITAISVYLNWMERNFTLVLKPKGMSKEAAESIVSEFEDTILCDNEKQLLEIFLDLIEDTDILTGWNSEGFDIPYIHNRIVEILGKEETRKLCHWGKFPKRREYESYGRDTITYDLVGRVHLDYLQLYRKHTYHEMHSYRLDFVGEYEVGEKKTHYEGTLDALYNNDFKKFIEYNKQDVVLLVKIDTKLKFIDLANNLAHTNSVLLQTTMGAVALIDQAIVNAAHDLGLMVPTRIRETEAERETRWAEETELGGSVVGAYVADPKPGMHDWIGGVDINSLYPSVIRAVNMSPETIVGQIRPELTDDFLKIQVTQNKKSFADAWGNVFGSLEYQAVMDTNMHTTPLKIDFEDGSTATVTAKEIYNLVWNNGKKLTLSANGTLFDSGKPGLIPSVLSRWYTERKELQADAKGWAKKADEATDASAKAEAKKQAAFFDQRQLIKKILLNSLYGAIGNPGSRWYDPRVAQSTTLCGRCIVKHMSAKINEIIAGDYNHVGKSIIYGDTDSAYFSAYDVMKDQEEFKSFEWSKENVIDLYDKIADITNDSFPEFMAKAFNCPQENGEIIKAGRELCAVKGLFITKKRYAVLIFDKEGKRKDQNGKPGEIKAMGLDLKRSDTPKVVQDFLSDVLVKVLTGADQSDVIRHISDFRSQFRSWDGWAQGSPKRANNITRYTNQQAQLATANLNSSSKKTMIPGHVLASLNWNKLKKIYGDYYSQSILDGAKVIVCKLKSNPAGITSIAYPVDQLTLPQWFKDLPFDHDAMEQALIDKKLDNLLGVLKWDLDASKVNNNFDSLFSF